MSRDPGLPQERTQLAWSRTGLSVAIAGVFVTVHASYQRLPSVALVALTGVLLIAVAAIRHRRHSAPRPHAHKPASDRPPSHGGLLVLMAGCTSALLLIELAIAVTALSTR